MAETKMVNNGISDKQQNHKSTGKRLKKKLADRTGTNMFLSNNKDLITKGSQALFYYSHVAVLYLDFEGRILSVNPATCALLQYNNEDFSGKLLHDFMPEEERGKYFESDLPAIINREHKQIVLCLLNKQGEKVYLLSDINELDVEDINTTLIFFAQDITARVVTEEKLVEEKRLIEDSAQAKQNFLANLSHEIRTPMNGILGISTLLGKTQLNDRQHNFLKLIQDSANNMLVIVNDVLDLEKIVAGKLQLEKLPFKIVDKIANIVQSFIYRAEEKGLAIIYQNTIPGDLVVTGDPFRLTQVLNNLLNNALKFTELGRIIINTRIQSIANDVVNIECSVKDTGIGMNEKFLKKVFEPFVQANSTITRKYGGTGLGLSICKNLVEIQDGTLRVQSEENVGSVFSFIVPYGIGEQQAVQQEASSEMIYTTLGKKRVLVVEDMELNQFIARHIMESWGFEVGVASDGNQAIELIKHNDYDLVLMDIQMPNLNGMAATRQIRRMHDRQKANVPIIALTGNSLNTEGEKYIAAGMNDYLAKPLSEAKLFEVVSANLNNDNINPIKMKTIQFDEIDSAPAEKLYDLTTIREISGGDEDFVNTMIALFIETVPANLRELNTSLQNKNWDMVSKMAHKLKSTLDSMGIHSISQDIRIVEQTAKTREFLDNIPALVATISNVVEKSIEQIQHDVPK